MKHIIPLIVLVISFALSAATSEENRADKKYELTFQAGMDYRMYPAQIAAMYFLDDNNLVGFKLGNAQDEDEEETQTNIALQYKHYASNSFYVAGEVFYLNTREDVHWIIDDILQIKNDNAEYTSLGAGIRIGNQWTWKHFTLGCDWIGVGHRFGTFKKDTDDLSNMTFTVLNIIIGASF